jgi:hypothetical protein
MMQLSQTSLVVACRQMAGPSSIHTLPTDSRREGDPNLAATGSGRDVTILSGCEWLVRTKCPLNSADAAVMVSAAHICPFRTAVH